MNDILIVFFIIYLFKVVKYIYMIINSNNMKFSPKSIEEERGILFYDLFTLDKDFKQTKKYLEPLVKQVIKEKCPDLNKEEQEKLYDKTIGLVNVALPRYINGMSKNIKYKFSTYFTWYIKEEIKKV